jgi:hypothetical protein
MTNMEEFKSGKQLCDDFFIQLLKRDDIDINIAKMLEELYSKGRLNPENIRKALKDFRDASQDTK